VKARTAGCGWGFSGGTLNAAVCLERAVARHGRRLAAGDLPRSICWCRTKPTAISRCKERLGFHQILSNRWGAAQKSLPQPNKAGTLDPRRTSIVVG
jgi:hypothetical protein